MRMIHGMVMILTITFLSYTHSGRTDKNGGHYNRKTGEYHYHNSGYSKKTSKNTYGYTTKRIEGATSVYLIQSGFKLLGFYNGAIDGISGSGTKNAIRNFQKFYHLPITGVLDKNTKLILLDKLKNINLKKK